MRSLKILVSGLLLVTPVLMAQAIPAGTVIPVMLQTTLDARKARVGQKIAARVTQDVPLSSQTRIPPGAKLLGHVVEVTRPSATSASRIAISFDRLMIGGDEVRVTTSLRSLASMMEVFEAQLPTNAIDDYGTTTSDWVTVQIGGDVVYRGAGIVMADSQVVGKSTIGGDVTAKLIASRDGACRGAVAGNDREQALWLFSPSACGPYGFADLKIVHAGRQDPVGQIILASDKNVHVPAGSGLLLRVTAPSGNSSTGSPSAGATSKPSVGGVLGRYRHQPNSPFRLVPSSYTSNRRDILTLRGPRFSPYGVSVSLSPWLCNPTILTLCVNPHSRATSVATCCTRCLFETVISLGSSDTDDDPEDQASKQLGSPWISLSADRRTLIGVSLARLGWYLTSAWNKVDA